MWLLACTEPGELRKSAPGGDSGPTAVDSDSPDSLDDVDSPDTRDSESWTRPERPETDSPDLGDSWRWGGGEGYPDVVDPTWPVVHRVADLASLESALAAAVAGEVVWVEDEAEIDLSGRSLCIPGGVWLAGGRGQGGAAGGRLYATEGAADAVLVACGEDVRITGLRIEGPDPETCPPEWPDACPNDVSGDVNCAYCTDTAYGISTGHDRLEVDNNELSGWTYAAVGVKDALDADVHHNHIHHGWREGLGYGVVLYGSAPTSALIRWNRLDTLRHAVAGQGYPDEDYVARDNLMGDAAISHVFDMHGQDEAADDGSPYAGGHIEVEGNIVLVADQYSFVLRGMPETGAWLYDNCLAPSSAEAYDQRYFYGNFHVDEDPTGASAPNAYGQSPGDCGNLHWCLADAVTGPVRYGSASGTPAADLLVGDLDGDGRDDVFGSSGSQWRWANPDGGSWASLATSSAALATLALADFDGDGVDDVFTASGGSWWWSKSGAASWAELRASPYGLDEVGFGDFDGDGRADVFTTDGSQWRYHPGGAGEAVALASSGVSIADLAFADFDGDRITDVFYASGSQWRWSRSGAASWADLATSSAGIDELAFADLDGDGITDVLSVASERLRVSWGGASSWQTLRYEHTALADLRFGDFDGDGRTDLLRGDCL